MLNIVDVIKAIFLGIIESLTEFLPVSSTAHLIISSHLINFNSIANSTFEIAIQFGAILAICIIYRQRICELIFNLKDKKQQNFAFNIALSFLPAAVIGLLFHDLIKKFLFSNFVIAISLISGGIIMIIIEQLNLKNNLDNIDKVSKKTAFKIGLFQVLAMIPGVSRSGSTIIGAFLCGLNRQTAATYSFFLAIPTISAASFFDLYKNRDALAMDDLALITIGLTSSFISAIFVIKWFLNFVTKNSFVIFGIYRILVGLLILFFIT